MLVISLLTGGSWLGLGRIEQSAVYPFDDTRVLPADAGLPHVTEREIRTNGETLIIWLAAPRTGRPTILYFHGNAGNLATRAGRFEVFLDRGYGLIAPAYRGSSGSSGRPSEPALTRDAVQIYRNINKLLPGTVPSKLVIYGESLGTGVAVKLLAIEAATPPAGVVLEAPFTSLPDVARLLDPSLELLIPRMKNIWDNLSNIRHLTAPLLVVHGTDDTLIPITLGRQVYAAAPSEPKIFLAVQGAGHTDLWRPGILRQMWQFIEAQAVSIR